jgi:hypothetical protein
MQEETTPTANNEQPAQPVDAEQLGPLLFVPNPNYPYFFKVAKPPRFWMEETTGALADAVETYMSGEPLAAEQLDMIKLYLRQYVERAVLASDANRKLLLSRVEKLKSTVDLETFADELSEYGAEVF